MGLVADIFTKKFLQSFTVNMAIGHTRYSTTGDSALLNAQPIRVDSTKGLIAIAHNGNLVNLGNVRAKLEREGAFFQTTSDSEIIVQLIAHSKEGTLVDAIADSLRQVDGAFSIVMMTRDRIFAARDPRGFRPLSMGRISNPDGPDTIVFASETCAFDLLRAKFERDVQPGELVMVTRDGVTSRQYSTGIPQSSCIFEHVYFARPDSKIFNRWVQESREEMGRQLVRESPVDADLVVPVPDSGVTAAIGYAAESGIPFRFGLIRNHYVGRTFIEPEQRVRDFGVKLKLNPVRNLLEGKRIILIDDSIIRGTTSRKIVRMVRAAGAKEVHLAHQLSADDLAVLLWCRYTEQTRIDRGQQFRSKRFAASLKPIRLPICHSKGYRRRATAARAIISVLPATPASIPRSGSMSKIFCPQPLHGKDLPAQPMHLCCFPFSGGSIHAGKEESEQPQVWQSSIEVCRARDAGDERGEAEERPQQEESDQPQTGHRHRPLRSTQVGRESS